MHCIEESTCDIVKTFRRDPVASGALFPLPPSLRPCLQQKQQQQQHFIIIVFSVLQRPLSFESSNSETFFSVAESFCARTLCPGALASP